MNKMRPKVGILFFVISILVTGISATAQTFFTGTEYGVMFGGSQYFGDLNTNYGFQTVHPAVGVFTRYHINPYISVKGVVNYTQVSYSDAYNTDPFEKERNLSFASNIVELAAQAEFNFFRFATGEDGSRFTPYLTGGLGVFYYNPYTYYNGQKYFLRPLGTEGQNAGYGRHYSSFSACFPIGAGVKYWLKPGLNLGFEIADRLTLTDYIDDVSSTYVGADKFPSDPRYQNIAAILQDRSTQTDPNQPLGRAGKQRGDNSSYDQYLMFQVTVSFQLKTYKCPGYIHRDIPRLR